VPRVIRTSDRQSLRRNRTLEEQERHEDAERLPNKSTAQSECLFLELDMQFFRAGIRVSQA
jgi:hypothetical protein